MYAVIGAGAGQQKVAEGERVHVDLLDGVTVTGKVVGEAKGPKINGFTYKRRTNQRRRYGHRQRYTVVEITKIATK